MGSSRRWGVRVVAVLAVASVAVAWAAVAAEARQISTVKQLKSSCAKGNGTFTAGAGGKSGVCDLPGGKTVICGKIGGKQQCRGTTTIARGLVPQKTVRAPNGVTFTTQGVPASQAFNDKVSVGVLKDLCTSLRGSFVASAGGAVGACSTKTAMIICNDASPGETCVGTADTKKHAASVSKQVATVAATAPTTPTTSGSTATTSGSTTTTTGATTTTRGTTPTTRG